MKYQSVHFEKLPQGGSNKSEVRNIKGQLLGGILVFGMSALGGILIAKLGHSTLFDVKPQNDYLGPLETTTEQLKSDFRLRYSKVT